MLKPTPIPILNAKDVFRLSPAHDLHLHTNFTDGTPTVREYVDKAIELGIEHIGFPEHCNHRTTWLPSFLPEIQEQRAYAKGRLHVHWGIEAKVIDMRGTLAAHQEMIDAAEYIYGAFHSSFTETKFPALDKHEAIDMEFQSTLSMIMARSCHAIAHPGGLSRKYHGDFPDTLIDELARHASAQDMALEINSGYGADVHRQLDIFIKHDCRVVLGSNAHRLEELGMIGKRLAESPSQ
jgi:putative hydrolase